MAALSLPIALDQVSVAQVVVMTMWTVIRRFLLVRIHRGAPCVRLPVCVAVVVVVHPMSAGVQIRPAGTLLLLLLGGE